MTAASRRPGPRLGRIALWLAAMMMSLISNGTTVSRAQQVGPGDPVIESAADPTLEKSEPTRTATEPGSIRVPKASNERSLLSHGLHATDVTARSPAAPGWWMGSTAIALALAICGAACAAARKYWPQNSTGLVRVVGRVSLSPRQSIFLVRAGRRVILIGAGGQGAPTLLGELSETEQADDQDEAADPEPSAFPGLAGLPAPHGGTRTGTGPERRLGDVP
jgi:flagellar biogenesis protein FliO